MYQAHKFIRGIVPATDTHFAVPFFSNPDPASLLLHLDGPLGSTSVIDATGRHTLVFLGTANIVNDPVVFGSGAANLEAVDGGIAVIGGGSDFAFGTGDYTIDFRLYIHNDGNYRLYAGGLLTDQVVTIDRAAGGIVYWRFSSGTQIQSTTATVSNVWYHIAVTRSSGNTRLFINGTQEGITYVGNEDFGNADASDCPKFGTNADNSFFRLDGLLDEIRVAKGVAVWTSNFTPPTSPYLPA